MKFGRTKAEAKPRQAVWVRYRADVFVNNRPLYCFMTRWVDEVEKRMNAVSRSRPHPEEFFAVAFVCAGGFELPRHEIQWAVSALEECWLYGEALKRWADARPTWMR